MRSSYRLQLDSFQIIQRQEQNAFENRHKKERTKKGFLKKVEISMKRCQRINSSFLNITMSEFSQRKRNVNESNTELKIDTITANQKKSSLWKISRGKKVVL